MSPPRTRPEKSLVLAARLVSAAVICGFLYYARVVLIPLGLAVLISFMLQPVVRRLRKLRLPHALSVFVTAGCFACLIALVMWAIGGQIRSFTEQLPTYQQTITSKLTEARMALRGGTLDRVRDTLDSVARDVDKAVPEEEKRGTETDPLPVVVKSEDHDWLDWSTLAALGPIIEPLSTAGLVGLLVVLMLLKWADLRSRLVGFLNDNLTGATQALDDAANRIGRYLGMQLLVNGSMGVAVGVSMWLLGVPYALLWGLCSALFRYVPYAGPVAAAVLPLTVSLVTSEGWSQVIAVAACILTLELISNNVVEPWLYGSSLGLSEIGIIVAAVVWTLLWGAAGLVLATPLTVCLVVIGEHVAALSFFVRLLGDKPTLSPHYMLYQRLLSKDEIEAADLVKSIARDDDDPREPAEVAVETLALARRERANGRLREGGARQILARLPRVMESAADDDDDDDDAAEHRSHARGPVAVVVWSACAFTDEALPFLDRQLSGLPCHLVTVKSRELTGAALSRLEALEEKPIALCLAHLHRDDFDRLRGILKRVRQTFPALPVLVARWGGEGFEPAERDTLLSSGAGALVEGLVETRDWLAPRVLDRAPTAAASA